MSGTNTPCGHNSMNSKKAQDSINQGLMHTIIAIIVIAGVVLVLFTLSKTDTIAKNKIEDTTCSASVRYAVGLSQASLGAFDSAITCPTKQFSPITDTKSDAVNFQIAQQMKTCWDDWGNGNLKLFSLDGIYCHVCSVITFEASRGDIEDLPNYLAITAVPGTSKSYAEYFLDVSTEHAADIAPKIGHVTFSAMPRNQPYAVLFVYARGHDTLIELSKKLPALGIGTTGVVGGGIILAKAAVLGSATIAGGTAAIIGVGVVGVGATAYALLYGTDIFNAPVESTSELMFVPYTKENVQAIGCRFAPVKTQTA